MKCMLIIGRFQPFHSGHLAIIKKYHSKGFFVKIVIGSAQKAHQRDNPFTKEERVEMIRRAINDSNILDYEIIFVPDVPDDKDWVDLVKKKANKVDVLFTGNPWVKKLFKKEDVEIHEYNERLDRIKGIKAKDIRKNLLNSKSRKGLPLAVFNYLKVIRAFDRLKDMNDSKKKVHYLLRTNNLTISVAESCTGGSISRALISYAGSSDFFKGSVVAYSPKMKRKILGVSNKTLVNKGVVSGETAVEMALGALDLFNTNYAVGTTGYADPSDKDSGRVFIAVTNKDEALVREFFFNFKDRNKIIDKASKEAIKLIYELLKKDLLDK